MNRNDTTCRTSVATMTAIVDTPAKRARIDRSDERVEERQDDDRRDDRSRPLGDDDPGQDHDGQQQRDRAADERHDRAPDQRAPARRHFQRISAWSL